MNILLTGGSGFIGRNIIEQLGGKYNIMPPGHKNLNLLDEVSVSEFFNTHPIDVVIHTASVGGNVKDAHITEVVEKNLRMFFNLSDNLKPEQKMLFMGSGAEYDKRRDIQNISEDEFGQFVPADDYGFSKYAISKFIEKSQNIINLRCFGVYGKYELPSRFISSIILDVLAGRPLSVRQNVVFDFLYVNDLVKIIDYFITHNVKHKIYNVVSGQPVDLISLANVIKQALKSNLEIVVEKEGLGREYTANNLRLLAEMGKFEFTSFESGIKDLHDYYEK